MKQQAKYFQAGFILILVIAALALVASALFILTSVSNRMADHTRRMYNTACERNDSASEQARLRINSDILEHIPPTGQPSPEAGSLQINNKKIPVKSLPQIATDATF